MGQICIVVIGAGIIGLTSAIQIQAAYSPDFSIVLVAEDWPGSETVGYATPWAGAHYRPIPDVDSRGIREASLARRTYKHFLTYAREHPEAGIAFMEGIDYLESPSAAYTQLCGRYANIDNFRVLQADELPPLVRWGSSYTTWCMNTSVYCSHLLEQFLWLGGRTIRRKLKNLDEAFHMAPRVIIVVNCSGIGFDDPASFITRGQTVLIRSNANKTITQQNADGSWSFVIPRPLGGGVVVGGTKEEHDWAPSPRQETRKAILDAAALRFPELTNSEGSFEVIRDIVGRRPSRVGGLRLESERLPGGNQVVHAYGAGGRGVEMSWGIGEAVVDLVRASLGSPAQKSVL